MNATLDFLERKEILSFASNNKVALSVGAVLALLVLFTRKSSKRPLPPGPRSLPIIGNVHQLPIEDDYLIYHDWAKRYGEIFHVSAWGQPMILLSSEKAITELLEKRSAIYSDRPYLRMVADFVGWKHTLALSSSSSDRFRKYRKLMHNALNLRSAERYYPLQERSAHSMMQQLLETPSNFMHHIRQNSGAVSTGIAYAYEINPQNDFFVDLIQTAADIFSRVSEPGAFWVEVMPWLRFVPKWFPGAGWKRRAEGWKKVTEDLHDIPYQMVKDKLAAGTAKPCFVTDLLNGENPTPEEDDIYKWAAGAIYAGGADTTVSAAATFILAMVLNPDVQMKAQAEIDKHMGPPSSVTRFPGFSDRESLPYIDALLKEVLRWHPVAPLGLPHRLTEDDIYEGYFIPAGANVIPIIWALGHDEKHYPEPDKFLPERFLDKGDGSPLPPNPVEYSFGFGRRVCPGSVLAWNSMYIVAVTLLACFEMVPVEGEDGKPIVPPIKYLPGTVSHPAPFQCQFKPRSPHIADLIRQTVAHERETL